MNASISNHDIKKFRSHVRTVPNAKLKAGTFDALHLDQFILEDQVSRL